MVRIWCRTRCKHTRQPRRAQGIEIPKPNFKSIRRIWDQKQNIIVLLACDHPHIYAATNMSTPQTRPYLANNLGVEDHNNIPLSDINAENCNTQNRTWTRPVVQTPKDQEPSTLTFCVRSDVTINTNIIVLAYCTWLALLWLAYYK